MKRRDHSASRLIKLAQHLAGERLLYIDMRLFDTPAPPPREAVRIEPGHISIMTYYWAIVQLPHLWPQHFAFHSEDNSVVAINGLDLIEAVMLFFNLSADELFHLLVPTEQEPHRYGGKILAINARPREVADNIVQFVSRKMTENLISNIKP